MACCYEILIYTKNPREVYLPRPWAMVETLICLTVILATRGHFATVPEDRVALLPEPRDKVASLLTMAAAAAAHKAVPWKAEFHALTNNGFHHERCINELQRHVREYDEPIFRIPQTQVGKGKELPRRLFAFPLPRSLFSHPTWSSNGSTRLRFTSRKVLWTCLSLE